MKDSRKTALAGLAGATVAVCVAPLAAVAETPGAYEAVGPTVQAVESVEVPGAGCAVVHNVQGTFAFTQDEITPSDDLFNIFGATVESMCSKPTVASAQDNGVASYYVNVGGDIKKAYTVNIAEMEDNAVENVLVAPAQPAEPWARRPWWACLSRRSSRWPSSRTA